MIEWSGLLLDVVKSGLGAVGSAAPDAWKKRAFARLNDANPFAATATNHDLLRAVRLAWIEAALAVVRAAALDAEREPVVARVVELARNELRDARTLAFDRDVDPAFSPIDAHLKLIMNGVSEPIASSAIDQRSQEITRDFASTFCRIIGWPIDELPPTFARIAASGLATKDGAPRDFGGLAFAEFAEILKSPTKYPEAGKAFQIATEKLARDLAEQTFAAVRGLDEKVDAALTQLDALAILHDGIEGYLGLLPGIADRIARVEASVDAMPEKMVAIFEKKEEAQRAESAGVQRFVILQLAKRITNVETIEQALIELDRAVEIAIKVQEEGARGSNSGAFVDEVLRRVAALSRRGLFDEAADEADNAFAQWQADERERRQTAQQGGLKLLDTGIEQNMMRRDAKAVARLEAQKIDLELSEANARFDALQRVQNEYYVRGRDKGVNLDLEVAIELAQITKTYASTADQRGAAQNNLGVSLQELGNRESDPRRLAEAVTGYRAGLKELTRKGAPQNWAAMQNNLGNALASLGNRESDPAQLKEAVTAYRAALKRICRARTPLNWAMTQNNLGSVLRLLGKREQAPARLKEAVHAHRMALTRIKRARTPLEWAVMQNNLGAALAELGTCQSTQAPLEEAVDAYRAALQERSRERAPLEWAMTQNNLGAALTELADLGESGSAPALLEGAVAAFRAALKEHTRERVPLDWAATQNNLGTALATLGELESEPARHKEAMMAYRAALQERTRERVPLDWVATQNNLGNAIAELGELESDPALLKEAIMAYRAALQERTREHTPSIWAQTHQNMANAFLILFHLTGLESDRVQALEALDEALVVYREAQSANDIGTAEALRAQILAAAPAP